MFTLSCSGGWMHGDYAARIRGAAALGYKAIELLGWKGNDLQAARAATDETGTVNSAFLIQSADKDVQKKLENSYGITHPDARGAFLQGLKETIAAAQILGMTKIVAVTGNEIQGISCALQHQTVVETLKAGAPLAEDAGMTIVLEPLNIRDHRGYFLQTAAEGAYIIDEVASPAVRLLYDVYHQQITEGDLIPNITKYIDRIGHIHIGDTPGRNEPGTGEINYPNIFKTIDSLGYTGFVTLECGCTRDVAEATKDIFAMLPQA